jgi:nitroreductase
MPTKPKKVRCLMELMEVIRTRRAVREYSDAAMERSTIQSLLEAAIQAPSAMNLQPWAFAVLLDRQRIDDYAERAKAWLVQSSQVALSAEAHEILEQPGFTVFYHAPALVLVLATSAGTQASEDCCLAAENLMLAARDHGIGTCWIGFARPWLDLPETKRELGLPEQYQVVAPIVLGVPKAWPEPHGRKQAEIHWLK